MFPEKHVGLGAQSVMVQLLLISQMQLRNPSLILILGLRSPNMIVIYAL